MMNKQSLLPSSASQFEAFAAQSGAAILSIAIPLRQLWQAEQCPTPLLPCLAWALSVDRWDSEWPEQTKRQVIKESFYIHRHKGTNAALRRAVQPFGNVTAINEWFAYNGQPGTFSMEIAITGRGITEQLYHEMSRVIDDVKPVSRHLTALKLLLESQGNAFYACQQFDGNELTIYPYSPEVILSSGQFFNAATVHFIDITEV